MPPIFNLIHHQKTKRLRIILISLGVIFWLGASTAALTPIFPHILYRLSPNTPTTLAANLAQTAPQTTTILPPEEPINLPPKDNNLTEKNTLIIESIGINGEIHEGENAEEVLENGIWRTPDFGTPQNNSNPIILASHRWGYLEWSNTFRRQNSFYNLPKLSQDDEIKIIWNQRLYTYKITDITTATNFPDLNTDLILYTCQLWNSPVRIFVSATRIK